MRSIPLFLLFHSALSFTPCPLLGPTYPPFKLDTRDPIIVDSLKNLTESFDELMRTGIGVNGPITKNTTTFGMALFSANNGNAEDEPFFWQYHYTAPEYKKIIGRPQNVTKESVYRIGGLTEVFTVWSLLLTVGDKIFNDPVTKYLPELANGLSTATSISHTKWDEITVGQIASHMAGIARDCEFAMNFLLRVAAEMIHRLLPRSDLAKKYFQRWTTRSLCFSPALLQH